MVMKTEVAMYYTKGDTLYLVTSGPTKLAEYKFPPSDMRKKPEMPVQFVDTDYYLNPISGFRKAIPSSLFILVLGKDTS